ncbi:MAG: YceI family protein [Bacteroidota bacterium]|nr:YceI family protein [Bacteroidota bacterium]MDE2835236.1 YceI family protein [Bacteroidota bacterium]MDE2957656.1 YceI family protein [Bacteroidota bacterium]
MHSYKLVLHILIVCLIICAPVSAQTTEYAVVFDSSAVTVDGTSNNTPEWTVYATEFSGDIMLSGADPASVDSAMLVVQTSMLKSRKSPIMDRGMHTALQANAYPAISYVLTEVTQADWTSDTEFLLNTAGNLTIGGATLPVSIPVSGAVTGEGVTYTGSHTLLMTDYGLKPPSMMFGAMRVGNEVVVNFSLYIAQAAD